MFGTALKLLFFLLAVLKFSLFNTGQDSDTPPDPTQGNEDKSGQEDKLYTQKDFDKSAWKLRKEGGEKAISELLKELGFEKSDDLKTLIADAKKRQEAEMSEMDKAKKGIEAEIKKREAIEQELNQLRLEKQQTLLDRAVETALQKSNAKKPADVLDLMKARGKLADILTDEGQIDDKKLTAAIEGFKKDNAEYFGSGNPGSPSNTGAKPPVPSDKKLQDAVKDHMRRLGGS